MAIEKVLEHTLDLVRRERKVVLPIVLIWIPYALFAIIALQAVFSVEQYMSLEGMQEILTDSVLLWQVIESLLPYIAVSVPVIVLSFSISVFLSCVYAEITRQSYTQHRVSLSQSFSVAKSRFLSLLWTYIVEFLIMVLVFVALIALGVLGGTIGGIVLAALIGIVSLVLFNLFFYETPAIVVLEGKGGLEAVKRSYEIGRRNLGSLFVVLLIVGIIAGTVKGGLGQIPYVGSILSTLSMLFLNTWYYMIPNVFYYEYEKRAHIRR